MVAHLRVLLGWALLLGWLWLQAWALLSAPALGRNLLGMVLFIVTVLWLVRLLRVGPGLLITAPAIRRLLAAQLLLIACLEAYEALRAQRDAVPQLTLAPLVVDAGLEPTDIALLQDHWTQRLQRVRQWQAVAGDGTAAHRQLQARLSQVHGEATRELKLELPGTLGRTQSAVLRADSWPALQEQAVRKLAELLDVPAPASEALGHDLRTLKQIRRCGSRSPDSDRALRQLRETVKATSASALAQAALGSCLLAQALVQTEMPLANQHEARAALNRALQLAPELPAAERDRARLARLLGEDPAQVQERFRALQDRYPYWPAITLDALSSDATQK